jgi:hypothetical protein
LENAENMKMKLVQLFMPASKFNFVDDKIYYSYFQPRLKRIGKEVEESQAESGSS